MQQCALAGWRRRRQKEGEEGVTSTGDCSKYVESNPLIRQQGVRGAIRFKQGVGRALSGVCGLAEHWGRCLQL